MPLVDKFKALKGPIKRCNKEEFGCIEKKTKVLEYELGIIDKDAKFGNVDETKEARRRALLSQIEMWYLWRDNYWKQLSRSKQAKEMDKNTRYFHAIACAKRRKKSLLKLKVNGAIFTYLRRIKNEVRSFYKKLYKQQAVLVIGFQGDLVNRISNEEAKCFEVFPTREEIKDAV